MGNKTQNKNLEYHQHDYLIYRTASSRDSASSTDLKRWRKHIYLIFLEEKADT